MRFAREVLVMVARIVGAGAWGALTVVSVIFLGLGVFLGFTAEWLYRVYTGKELP